ncbi:MAG: aminotransferase class V-fold PLP-dependent enzyme [Planctomycetales bacterium]
MLSWTDVRARMPVAGEWAYFDHAAVAPLSGPARDALREWADDVAAAGDAHWPQWRARIERARQLAAELIGADEAEVALVRNTTEGVNLVAEGYPWRPGDNVVLPAGEFPTNLYPWLNLADRGVEVRQVPAENERLDLDRLADACDERTRIVAASWVGYATGWRNDPRELAEVAHSRGALLFLDAIQGLGVFPLDVRTSGVDFLAADGHKWLLGPEGAGVFFIRREHLDRLRPLGLGWNSVRNPGDFEAPGRRTDRRSVLASLKEAGRYEGGSYNVGGIAALAESLAMLLEFAVPRISERLLAVTDGLCRSLEDAGASIASSREGERRSGIVAFDWPGEEPGAVRRRCLDRKVVLSCRGGRLRISPHVYSNDEDAERLLAALRG